jgi:hypothetical protein
MARPRQKNLGERLTDAGEEAIQRLGSAPGGERVLALVNTMRERSDELQKKLRGFDALEKRLAALERRVDKVEGKGTARRRASSTTKRSTAKRSTAKRTTPSTRTPDS